VISSVLVAEFSAIKADVGFLRPTMHPQKTKTSQDGPRFAFDLSVLVDTIHMFS
jgi:hypothetical protein